MASSWLPRTGISSVSSMNYLYLVTFTMNNSRQQETWKPTRAELQSVGRTKFLPEITTRRVFWSHKHARLAARWCQTRGALSTNPPSNKHTTTKLHFACSTSVLRKTVTHRWCYTDGVRGTSYGLTPDRMGNGRFQDPALGKNRPSSFIDFIHHFIMQQVICRQAQCRLATRHKQ